MINYALITKPGIILGNLLTVAAGFLLASKGEVDLPLFFFTLAGLTLIMASACVFNNYIDRDLDKKMERTKKRALVQGLISNKEALVFATLLGIAGNLLFFFQTNLLTLLVADAGFVVYVLLYSLWKRHTIYATAIGSIAGATPPVVGYCAVSNSLDGGALILFAMMVLWQMPHFFSIALYRFDDYVKAEIPVLPILKGAFRAKIHMTLYILLFLFTTCLLPYFGYTGEGYLIAALLLGGLWLLLCLGGFSTPDDRLWGRRMFHFSLVTITLLSLLIPFNVKISLI